MCQTRDGFWVRARRVDDWLSSIPERLMPWFRPFRGILGLCLVVYAAWLLHHLMTLGPHAREAWRLHLIFWAFVPPLWFFFERAGGEPKTPASEAAEKLWAAVLLVGGIFAINLH
jgi:hypothetical protein